MISSMTAFARQMEQTPYGQFTWEVRSVNHRYLEIGLRLPESLRSLEKKIRELLGASLKRGKVDVMLRFQPGEEVPFELKINSALVKQLAALNAQVRDHFSDAQTQLMDLLSWPGVLETTETRADVLAEQALRSLEQTIAEVTSVRQREGEGIAAFLEARLLVILAEVEKIEKRVPKVQKQTREKILQRFEELALEPNAERVEQEMVYLLQKMDVAEELQRLLAHMEEVRRLLKKGGVIGRRLDFLMQELNREANTLGSKSADADVTQSVVEMKVQIEQMREQVQNIE